MFYRGYRVTYWYNGSRVILHRGYMGVTYWMMVVGSAPEVDRGKELKNPPDVLKLFFPIKAPRIPF